MDPLKAWPLLIEVAALSIPLVYGLAAILRSGRDPFLWASRASAAALGLALVVAAGVFFLPAAPRTSSGLSLRLDGVTGVVGALVSFIAFIIVRFSRPYLRGDRGQTRYARWLMATLAAVSTLVVTNNLGVMAAAWVATSLALHQLLTFYSDRPAALVAAHKKFLASRVADLCLFGGIGLLAMNTGSLELDRLGTWAQATPELPVTAQAAAMLFAVAACLKCAQLPFHGWLIQVMEAPTPVSALLHAGVVNIGGFLMIRLASLMLKAQAAQTLLVVVGTASAVVAALVMTSRVSVKVMLAWSTCAQMGFMLVQCGLGAYSLALLHLLAHSLYKAHAFLSSGSAVDRWRALALSPARARAGFGHCVMAAAAGFAGVTLVAALYGASPQREPALWALAAVLSLALAPLLVRSLGRGWGGLSVAALGGLSVAALYFTWHALLGHIVPPLPSTGSWGMRLSVVLAGFGSLFLVQAVMVAWPDGRVSRALYPRLFAGLYLDELSTRLTFQMWPPKLPRHESSAPNLHVVETIEA